MTPHELRSPRRAIPPLPGACEPLTRLVYELLDAHDDTARIATGQDLNVRWHAHLSYLRDLQRVARELLAHAGQREDAQTSRRLMLQSETRNIWAFRGSVYSNTTWHR